MVLAGLRIVADREHRSTSAAAVSPAARTGGSSLPGPRHGGVDLSGVTLRIGETGCKQQELLLENAGLADTPYKTEFSLFQGGNLQLEALGAGAIDLASASEIPPIFAAQSGGPGSLNIIAVREGTTLHPGGGGAGGQHHHRRRRPQGQEGRLRAEHHGALLPVKALEGRRTDLD